MLQDPVKELGLDELREPTQNMGVVVYPCGPIDAIGDAAPGGVEVPTVLGHQHQRFVEQSRVDPTLLTVRSVIGHATWLSIRFGDGTAQTIQTLGDFADGTYRPPFRIRGGFAEHIEEDGPSEYFKLRDG